MSSAKSTSRLKPAPVRTLGCKPKLGTLEDLVRAAVAVELNHQTKVPATTEPAKCKKDSTASQPAINIVQNPAVTSSAVQPATINNIMQNPTVTPVEVVTQVPSKSIFVKTSAGSLTRVDIVALPVPKEVLALMKENEQLKKEINILKRRFAVAIPESHEEGGTQPIKKDLKTRAYLTLRSLSKTCKSHA